MKKEWKREGGIREKRSEGEGERSEWRDKEGGRGEEDRVSEAERSEGGERRKE